MVSANLVVYPRKQMTAQDFALLIETLTTNVSGIIYGCELSVTSGTQLHVNSGWAVVRGRVVRIEGGDMTVEPSGTAGDSYVYITVDLKNSGLPAAVVVSAEELTDTENFNVTNDGKAYLVLGIATFTETALTAVTSSEKIVPVYQRTRNIHVSTSLPTPNDGADGDIWMVYAP